MKKTRKRAKRHVVVGTIEPKHVETLGVIKEPVALVAVPKSMLQKVLDWLEGSYK